MKKELSLAIVNSALAPTTAENIKSQFAPLILEAVKLNRQSKNITVTDISQKKEMKLARENRLALRQVRIAAEKVKKTLKEDSLKYASAVQSVYNLIENYITPLEKRLEDQEKFEEIYAAKVKAELKIARDNECKEYSEFMPTGLDLSNMPKESYDVFLSGLKAKKAEKIEADRKAEEERIEAEKIRIENEKLKQEAAEKEKQLEEERRIAKIESDRLAEIANQERIKREELEKAENERKAQEQEEKDRLAKIESDRLAQEEQARKEKEEADRQAALAPDMEKLENYSKKISALILESKNIELTDKSSKEILSKIILSLVYASNIINNEKGKSNG